MGKDETTKSFDWDLPKIADKAEREKMVRSFHEEEKAQNKDRLLYPPDDIGPATQLNYTKERRD
jgi:hypothetical protein